MSHTQKRRSHAKPIPRKRPTYSPGWGHRVFGLARSGWAAIPIAATLIGISFTVWHELHATPRTRKAALSRLTLDRNVSFGQYLDRIESPRTPYTAKLLARRGIYLEFDISITGFEGKRLPLRWILLDQRSNNLVNQAEALRIRPRAEDDAGTWFTWVPIPKSDHTYVVRLQLYDDQIPARPLARLDSKPFQLGT
jgi:hypothetical protein